MKKFGKLEEIDPREIWNGEASVFASWLSQEENIAELGNATGMELEVQEQEQNNGAVHPDILCKNVLTDHFVMISAQLDQTDNTYLGQLMTSAAGLKAVTIIWIARAFAEEHRTTLSWLNNITNESIKFFGIEIKVFKIGDSLPAPGFNIIVKSNDSTKEAKKSTPAKKLADLEYLQLEYWHGLKNFMEENNSFVKLLGTPPKSLFDIAHDRGKYILSVAVDSQDDSLNISLTVIGEKAMDDFERLYKIAFKDSVAEISKDLIWYNLQANIKSVVTLKTYADFTQKNDWINQFVWFKQNLEKFDNYFRPKIKQLY
jgi:hypothetical protein